MDIIEFFKDGQKENWIKEIKKCSWVAAKYLAELIESNRFEAVLGKGGKLFLMCDGDRLVSFVTLTHQDCIDDPQLFPWLGFLFTVPEYRGNRYSEKIISYACEEASRQGHKKVYLATDHIGLYEKYGFIYKENRPDTGGEDSRIYYKILCSCSVK